MNEITKFEANKRYSMNSVCDHNCIWTFKVIKRTAKMITLFDELTKEVIKKKVSVFMGEEIVKPLGSYSFAPILGAEKAI